MATAQLAPAGVGIHNVLIATDFSRYSEQALDFGLDLAREYAAIAHIVFVLPADDFTLAGPEAYVAAKDAALRDLENLKLELKRARACAEGEEYQLYLLEGDVAQRILSFAREKHIDVIVLGTHGRSGLGKALMGSVAERVFRASPVPVLTIGPNVCHPAHALAPKKILVASDFTSASERAAQYAAELAREHDATLTLLHVLNPKDLEHVPDRDCVIHEIQTKLEDLLGPEAGVVCTPRVETGALVNTILQIAEEMQADLLVLGVRSSAGVLIRFMWPNAYQIVRQSSCPVLTVRGN